VFSRADFDEMARLALDAWRSGRDRDWSVPAGTLEWSCTTTADHTVDAVFAVALFLASRKEDGYPDWGWDELTMGPDATPDHLVEALATVARMLSAVIAVAEPDARAVIWRFPRVEVRGPEDFAPRGGLELVLHAHDVCAGLGIPFEPPADVCARLREHTRGWPHWTSPGWAEPPSTDDPWMDVLVGSGRAEIWTHESVTRAVSNIEGDGLFAADDIAAGTMVARLGGRLASTVELTALIDAADADPDAAYVDSTTIDEDVHLVLPPDTLVHYVNHSCDPNLWHQGAYRFVARRDIRAGEELTVDYATSAGAPGLDMVCRCDSSLCRGVISSDDWKRPDLQARYEGHWVPALAARIADS
jgi:hypothetical protein